MALKWPWELKKQPEEPKVLNIGNVTGGKLDIYSGTWGIVVSWAQKEIDRLREDNDMARLSERETQFIRGRIQGMKDLIDLPNEPPNEGGV